MEWGGKEQEAGEMEQARRGGVGGETAGASPERRAQAIWTVSTVPVPGGSQGQQEALQNPLAPVCVRMPTRSQKLAAWALPICQH